MPAGLMCGHAYLAHEDDMLLPGSLAKHRRVPAQASESAASRRPASLPALPQTGIDDWHWDSSSQSKATLRNLFNMIDGVGDSDHKISSTE